MRTFTSFNAAKQADSKITSNIATVLMLNKKVTLILSKVQLASCNGPAILSWLEHKLSVAFSVSAEGFTIYFI